MPPQVHLSLVAVALIALAACSGGQSSQPETTTTTDQTTTSSVTSASTTSTVAATTTTTVAATSTTGPVSTTTTAGTTTMVTTTTAPPATTTTVAPATTTTAPAAGRQLTITIAGFQYSGDMTGRVGDTVRVVNNDLVSHTWTAKNGAFDSGSIGPGQSFTYTFDQPGTFEFYCIPHPGMVGTITITS